MKRVAGCLLVLMCGCPAQQKSGGNSTPAPDPEVAPPVSPSCVTDVNGRIISVATDGGALVLFAQVVTDGGTLDRAGVTVPLSTGALACGGLTVGARPLLGAGNMAPLCAVATQDRRWLFFHSNGFGVAQEDPDAGVFFRSPSMLWTADRPAYGTACLEKDGWVYAYGCLGYGFLRAHCFVARVPDDRVADESAYVYYEGGGHWTPRVDDAWPIMEAGLQVSVHFDAARQRYLAVYARPLDNVLRMRSGLAPEGPWSREFPVASCAHPEGDTGTFCSESVAHPWMDPGVDGGLAVSYAPGTFQPTAPPEAYRARLSVVPYPQGLP